MPRDSRRARHARKVKRAASLKQFEEKQIERDREIWVNPGVDLSANWFYRVLLSIKALFTSRKKRQTTTS